MPEPRTTPKEHDVPVFQPGDPTPEDPRKNAPVKDPPVHPESDIERQNPVRRAGEPEKAGGVKAPNPSPDHIVYDEDGRPG